MEGTATVMIDRAWTLRRQLRHELDKLLCTTLQTRCRMV